MTRNTMKYTRQTETKRLRKRKEITKRMKQYEEKYMILLTKSY